MSEKVGRKKIESLERVEEWALVFVLLYWWGECENNCDEEGSVLTNFARFNIEQLSPLERVGSTNLTTRPCRTGSKLGSETYISKHTYRNKMRYYSIILIASVLGCVTALQRYQPHYWRQRARTAEQNHLQLRDLMREVLTHNNYDAQRYKKIITKNNQVIESLRKEIETLKGMMPKDNKLKWKWLLSPPTLNTDKRQRQSKFKFCS